MVLADSRVVAAFLPGALMHRTLVSCILHDHIRTSIGQLHESAKPDLHNQGLHP